MKFIRCFFLFFLSLAFVLNAQPRHSLWQVKENKNTVYLLGSVHVLSPKQYPLPKIFTKAFNQSTVVVFEVHPDSMNAPWVQNTLVHSGLFPNDSTLKMALGDSVFTLAQKACAELGFPIQSFLRMRPWMFSLSLMQLKLKQMHFDPRFGLDRYFFRKTKQTQKTVLGLETVGFQLSLFKQFSRLEQRQLVLQTIDEINHSGNEINQLISAWQQGNAFQLDSLLNASFTAFPKLYEKLLVRRNENWLKQIRYFLKQDKTYLIIVGAGHLVGHYGLVHLLENAGYSVKQL